MHQSPQSIARSLIHCMLHYYSATGARWAIRDSISVPGVRMELGGSLRSPDESLLRDETTAITGAQCRAHNSGFTFILSISFNYIKSSC